MIKPLSSRPGDPDADLYVGVDQGKQAFGQAAEDAKKAPPASVSQYIDSSLAGQ